MTISPSERPKPKVKYAASWKHGMHASRTYSSWQNMIQRCQNPRSTDYSRYGGRGITITERWLDFSNFLEDMGPRPDGTTLDRIDVNKGYGPDNCRWATSKEQSANREHSVYLSTPLGTMMLVEYAAAIGISRGAARLRLDRGRLTGCVRVGAPKSKFRAELEASVLAQESMGDDISSPAYAWLDGPGDAA